jgi:hypothetical protein
MARIVLILKLIAREDEAPLIRRNPLFAWIRPLTSSTVVQRLT